MKLHRHIFESIVAFLCVEGSTATFISLKPKIIATNVTKECWTVDISELI